MLSGERRNVVVKAPLGKLVFWLHGSGVPLVRVDRPRGDGSVRLRLMGRPGGDVPFIQVFAVGLTLSRPRSPGFRALGASFGGPTHFP